MNATHRFGDDEFALYCLRNVPFYHTERTTLLPFISDQALSVIAPFLAYWFLSLAFHLMDTSQWSALDQYRIHDSKEVKSRNLATPGEVIRAVVVQQVIQTALGLFWLGEPTETTTNRLQSMQALGTAINWVSMWCLGEKNTTSLFEAWGREMIWYTYWWAVPILQLLFAMFVIDTWQYFLHRLFHVNKFLYKHFHSVHHRLYVPYAFGALYNHPLEGFLLDSLGAVIAHSVSFMSVRQAILLFTVSTLKTVDDHCGYSLPFDPLQFLFGNNADYHDIHHQVVGIKHNFSQPFFVHWDALLGTRMTRQEIERRRQDVRAKTS